MTILKPLCGEDAGLYENLLSFCRQDYPDFQIVFGVNDPADPAVAVVRRLIAEFPEADLDIVIDQRRRAANRKVANLLNMLPAARHPLLVFADSDMRVTPDYLSRITAPLARPGIGLVTCLYRGIPDRGAKGRSLCWSQLACLHVNNGFLPQAAVGEAMGAGAGCFGATIALSRDTLERAGGLSALAEELADDHVLGAAVRRTGGRIAVSPYLVDNIIAEPSLAGLFRHEMRWARTIRLIAPSGYIGSVVTYPVALAALATLLGVLPVAAPAVLAAALLCRAATVRYIDRLLTVPPSPLLLVLFRDLLSMLIFVASFFARTVAWRNSTFRVGPGGQLTLDGDRPA